MSPILFHNVNYLNPYFYQEKIDQKEIEHEVTVTLKLNQIAMNFKFKHGLFLKYIFFT